jgi:hypothetical protein
MKSTEILSSQPSLATVITEQAGNTWEKPQAEGKTLKA